MASDIPNHCEICHEIYNEEEHCPRNLPCSHCFCHNCIDQLIIRNKKACPNCRQEFEANSVQELGKNRALIEVLKYVEQLEAETRTPPGEEERSLARMMKDFKNKNKKTCKRNMDYFLGSRLQLADIGGDAVLMGKLLSASEEISEDIVPKLYEMHTKLQSLVRKLQVEDQRVKLKEKEAMSNEKRLRDLEEELSWSQDFMNAAPIMHKTEKTNTEMTSLMHDMEEFINRQQRVRLAIGQFLKEKENTLTIIQEVLNYSHDDQEEEEEGVEPITFNMVAMAIKDDTPQCSIKADDLRVISDPLKTMIEEERIFAVQLREGKRRYAKITFDQNHDRLFLHHLKENEQWRPDAQFIKFDQAMSLVDMASRSVFLEFGVEEGRADGGQSLGKIIVKLTKNSNYSLNFAYLCTGERGPTYTNTQIDDQGADKSWVSLGYYKLNNQKNGNAVVTGVDWKKEFNKSIHNRTEGMKGFVQGKWSDKSMISIFYIFLTNKHNYTTGIFGNVEEGLNVLTEAISKNSLLKDVKVTDSGIVLN